MGYLLGKMGNVNHRHETKKKEKSFNMLTLPSFLKDFECSRHGFASLLEENTYFIEKIYFMGLLTAADNERTSI